MKPDYRLKTDWLKLQLIQGAVVKWHQRGYCLKLAFDQDDSEADWIGLPERIVTGHPEVFEIINHLRKEKDMAKKTKEPAKQYKGWLLELISGDKILVMKEPTKLHLKGEVLYNKDQQAYIIKNGYWLTPDRDTAAKAYIENMFVPPTSILYLWEHLQTS